MCALWVLLACESLHVCTVSIWRCEHARYCVDFSFYALYNYTLSFIHSFVLSALLHLDIHKESDFKHDIIRHSVAKL